MISSMTCSGVMDTALRTAAPDSWAPKRTGPRFRMLLATMARTSSDWFAPSPNRSTRSAAGVPASRPRTIARAFSGVRAVKTTPSTMAEGSWSFMPMQEVGKSPIRPSGETSPNRQPAASSKARATAVRPFIREVTESFRYTVDVPRGVREKKW